MVEPDRQPNLITFEDQETKIVLELFPAVWQAAEKLISADAQQRHAGLDDLLVTEAARISPMIAYLLITRLFDPDQELRSRIVEALANVMRRDAEGRYANEAVRSQIISGLVEMGDPGLQAMIEAGVDNEAMLGHIARLINFAPNAGNFLKDLAADRSRKKLGRSQHRSGRIEEGGQADPNQSQSNLWPIYRFHNCDDLFEMRSLFML